METAAPVSSNIPGKRTYSCMRCADRKVKCDRKTPCDACVRHNVDCVYNSSHKPRNRTRRLNNNQILSDRLKQLETILIQKGLDPDQLQRDYKNETRSHSMHAVEIPPNDLELRTSLPDELEPQPPINKAQVIQDSGRSKIIDNVLWTKMVEELHDPQEALENISDDSNASDSSDDLDFVLETHLEPATRSHHPPPEGIHQLWQVFVENVDPLTKVIHVPTLNPAIERATRNIDLVPKGLEALMFSIYSAAIVSLSDEECLTRLNEQRNVLLSRYLSATRKALSRARFMGTTSLIVLQALIIYLLAIRDTQQPRVIWSLTGVAVRIAQGMGLERDGTYLDLPPFETEMRRRIWWQLRMHDFRTAELCGVGKFRDIPISPEDTKWPSNVDDDKLYPGMTAIVIEPNKLTDNVFVATKCELLKFAAGRVASLRQEGKSSSPWDPEVGGNRPGAVELHKEIEEILEAKYLRYCDPSQPLHLITMLMARCAVNVIIFMGHHPRRWASRENTPVSERQLVWDTCIRLLEQHNMLQSNPQLKGFAWYAPYFQQWHAIIHILDNLRAEPLIPDADKAWRHIGNIYKCNPDMALDMRKPIHIAVRNLCLKAYATREKALQNEGIGSPAVPEFIKGLREQREIANSKAQKRLAKGSRNWHLAGVTHGTDVHDKINSGVQNINSHAPVPTSDGAPVLSEGDASGFVYGFDDNIGDASNVNMDLDFMQYQDFGMEDGTTLSAIWDQWDSWLADSNSFRPL